METGQLGDSSLWLKWEGPTVSFGTVSRSLQGGQTFLGGCQHSAEDGTPLENRITTDNFEEWLEEKLDSCGLDAVLYGRCILSILKQPQQHDMIEDEFDQEGDLFQLEFSESEIPESDVKKEALLECLKSAESDKLSLRLLVKEILERYTATSKDEIAQKKPNESIDSGVCPSPEESFQNYDEAFPPLVEDELAQSAQRVCGSDDPGQHGFIPQELKPYFVNPDYLPWFYLDDHVESETPTKRHKRSSGSAVSSRASFTRRCGFPLWGESGPDKGKDKVRPLTSCPDMMRGYFVTSGGGPPIWSLSRGPSLRRKHHNSVRSTSPQFIVPKCKPPGPFSPASMEFVLPSPVATPGEPPGVYGATWKASPSGIAEQLDCRMDLPHWFSSSKCVEWFCPIHKNAELSLLTARLSEDSKSSGGNGILDLASPESGGSDMFDAPQFIMEVINEEESFKADGMKLDGLDCSVFGGFVPWSPGLIGIGREKGTTDTLFSLEGRTGFPGSGIGELLDNYISGSEHSWSGQSFSVNNCQLTGQQGNDLRLDNDNVITGIMSSSPGIDTKASPKTWHTPNLHNAAATLLDAVDKHTRGGADERARARIISGGSSVIDSQQQRLKVNELNETSEASDWGMRAAEFPFSLNRGKFDNQYGSQLESTSFCLPKLDASPQPATATTQGIAIKQRDPQGTTMSFPSPAHSAFSKSLGSFGSKLGPGSLSDTTSSLHHQSSHPPVIPISPFTHFIPIRAESMEDAYYPKPGFEEESQECETEEEIEKMREREGYLVFKEEQKGHQSKRKGGTNEKPAPGQGPVPHSTLKLRFKVTKPSKMCQTTDDDMFGNSIEPPESEVSRWSPLTSKTVSSGQELDLESIWTSANLNDSEIEAVLLGSSLLLDESDGGVECLPSTGHPQDSQNLCMRPGVPILQSIIDEWGNSSNAMLPHTDTVKECEIAKVPGSTAKGLYLSEDKHEEDILLKFVSSISLISPLECYLGTPETDLRDERNCSGTSADMCLPSLEQEHEEPNKAPCSPSGLYSNLVSEVSSAFLPCGPTTTNVAAPLITHSGITENSNNGVFGTGLRPETPLAANNYHSSTPV